MASYHFIYGYLIFFLHMLSESLDQIEKEVDMIHYLNVDNIRSCSSAFRYFEGEKNPQNS